MKFTYNEKILNCIETMIVKNLGDNSMLMPYYSEFLLHVNIQPSDKQNITTAAVNVTSKGMNFYYNDKFINSLTQKEVNFICLHELFHLLFNHPKRTRMYGYDHKLSNIAQDMIINHILVSEITNDFINVPKDHLGRNTALFIPDEYKGEMIFEVLYEWLKNKQDKKNEIKSTNKLFQDLYFQFEKPHPKQSLVDSLMECSLNEFYVYKNNFLRKVLLSLNNNLPIKIIGHASVIENNPLELSLNRASILKQTIINEIPKIIITTASILEIVNYEAANTTLEYQLSYILEFNPDIKVQDEKVLNVYKEYRIGELSILPINEINNILYSKNLKQPNINDEINNYLKLTENLITIEGKGADSLLSLNEKDDMPCIVNPIYSKVKRYKYLDKVSSKEYKQMLNRRVEYHFDESLSDNPNNETEYGTYGMNEQETYHIDDLMEIMEDKDGEFLDNHIEDEISSDIREDIIKDIHEKLKSRGLVSNEIETILDKLQKKKKDYLKEIKRSIAMMKGNVKIKTFTRPNRKNIGGMKGNKKNGYVLNCILDTSGSMEGYFEKVLSYVFRSDIVLNLIMCDSKVQTVYKIKNMYDLNNVIIKGLGGTEIQPAVNYITEHYNQFNTIILTDGMTDKLDFSNHYGKVLILSHYRKCPISKTNGKINQIVIE